MNEPLAAIEATIQLAPERWLTFSDPQRVVVAEIPQDVAGAIGEVERLTRERGWWAVGFVAYEAGQAFGLATHSLQGLPLVWFACFEPSQAQEAASISRRGGYRLGPIAPSWTEAEFAGAFARVKRAIADGDTYQANLTFRMTAAFSGEPRDLWADLVAAQRGEYSAYLAVGRHAICSASPELFFRLDGPSIATRPMKGTARRGLTTAGDETARRVLEQSAKERAENVMIVDMMRNDLGRIADVGSVTVPALFTTERYPTVWQLTSTVRARSTAPIGQVFAALHPSASVTGAPKVRTMALLRELEPAPRGVYTGAVGYIRPDGDAVFNVAIRTAVVDRPRGQVEFGIGSGIVWDSDAVAEYQEGLLKGMVLGAPAPDFELLETLRWHPEEGFVLLERHLDRLGDSAAYFGRHADRAAATRALDAEVAGVTTARRLRLLVNAAGEIRVQSQDVASGPVPLRVALAAQPVDAGSVWLYHKTTQRQVYDEARAGRPGFDEVVLWNARGEVTEGTTTNLVVESDGHRVTPPVSCGLLAGTFRAELLARGQIREQTVTRDQLQAASRFWLINSVHGWRDAVLAG